MKKKSNKKQSTKQKERDDLFHLRHGFRPDGEQKGVTILSQYPRPTRDDMKGVEIHDPRNG